MPRTVCLLKEVILSPAVNGATASNMCLGRRVYALALCALMLASLPALTSATEAENFSVQANIDSQPQQEWYVAGDALNISVTITNAGQADELVSNPSCPAILSAYSQSGTLLYDGLDDAGCRQQSRGTDFSAGEVIDWAELSWDFTTADDDYLPSGPLSIVVSIPDTNLSTNLSVLWQAPVDVAPELEMGLITAQSPAGTFSSAESLFTKLRLFNTGQEEINQFSDPDCRLRFTASQNEVILTDRLTNLACDGGMAGATYGAAQMRDYQWLEWDFFADSGDEAQSGEIVIEIGWPDRSQYARSTVQYLNLGLSENTNLSGPNSPLHPNVIMSAEVGENGMMQTNSGETLGFSGVLTNTGDEAITASFTSICRIEVFVINLDGEIVYDTRDGRDCRSLDIDHYLEPDDDFSVSHADWPLIDRTGCGLTTGAYTVVVDVPEFRVRSTTEFFHSDDGRGIACLATAAPSGGEVTQQFSFSQPSISMDNDDLNISISLNNDADVLDLQWVAPCRLSVQLIDSSTSANMAQLETWCGAEPNERLRISPNAEVNYSHFTMLMRDASGAAIQDGQYLLIFRINSLPATELQHQFTWPLIEENIAIENSTGFNSSDNANVTSPDTLSGTWKYVTTESGGCWMLNAGGQMSLLVDATAVYPWVPQPNTVGTYSVVEDSNFSPDCMQWENGVAVIEVLHESVLPDESSTSSTTEETAAESESNIQLEEVMPTAIAVVASTSLLGLLMVGIVSNESWRIPLTQVGLAFIGLVGRTHETSDGKYQRGRLMGYLTANPGCHFRALMAALDMSNGQITHHLKVLNEEEAIWRRKDGRLMRFYPATINADTPADELPIPALSPDPNSLQGKILTLLDNDGQLGTYPTQKDLAERLERSQQLISHHLRTLQKYGLIEKNKSGLKNRYKLTKEAVFLLNQI